MATGRDLSGEVCKAYDTDGGRQRDCSDEGEREARVNTAMQKAANWCAPPGRKPVVGRVPFLSSA